MEKNSFSFQMEELCLEVIMLFKAMIRGAKPQAQDATILIFEEKAYEVLKEKLADFKAFSHSSHCHWEKQFCSDDEQELIETLTKIIETSNDFCQKIITNRQLSSDCVQIEDKDAKKTLAKLHEILHAMDI